MQFTFSFHNGSTNPMDQKPVSFLNFIQCLTQSIKNDNLLKENDSKLNIKYAKID